MEKKTWTKWTEMEKNLEELDDGFGLLDRSLDVLRCERKEQSKDQLKLLPSK